MANNEIIKLNYPAMMEMAQHCRMVAQRLQETARMAQGIAGKLEGGSLVGEAGNNFSGALRQGLTPAVMRLSAKFEELERDIKVAIDIMQKTDSGVGGNF